jgi:hypothetical protein
MLSAYPLLVKNLSQSLCKQLLDYADSYILNEAYDPNQEMAEADWIAFNKFHEQTQSQPSTYKTFPLAVEYQQKIYNELDNSVFPFHKFEIEIQYITSGERLCTHRDVGRTLNLIYNLTADQSLTEFYHKKINDQNRYVFALDELEGPTETHCFLPYTWYLFNNQQVHSVINSNQKRIALTLNIDATFQDFLKYFENANLVDYSYTLS